MKRFEKVDSSLGHSLAHHESLNSLLLIGLCHHVQPVISVPKLSLTAQQNNKSTLLTQNVGQKASMLFQSLQLSGYGSYLLLYCTVAVKSSRRFFTRSGT